MFIIVKCSRTRLEFKEEKREYLKEYVDNAVAPDWNLKRKTSNVNSPIWLKCSRTRLEFKVEKLRKIKVGALNAVAPDWNLKLCYS